LARIVKLITEAAHAAAQGDTMTAKVWMITGASRGLGAEIAKAVLDAGDKLIATARGVEAIEHLGGHKNVVAVSVVCKLPLLHNAVEE
jgi:NADP-dependent 3-hydroxy acid dehydrogenase YdfG